jgi:hypothetical protein
VTVRGQSPRTAGHPPGLIGNETNVYRRSFDWLAGDIGHEAAYDLLATEEGYRGWNGSAMQRWKK